MTICDIVGSLCCLRRSVSQLGPLQPIDQPFLSRGAIALLLLSVYDMTSDLMKTAYIAMRSTEIGTPGHEQDQTREMNEAP